MSDRLLSSHRMKVVVSHHDGVPRVIDVISEITRIIPVHVLLEEPRASQNDVHGLNDPSFEIPFQISSDSWKQLLLPFCRIFQELCLNDLFCRKFPPLLLVSDPGFFSECFISAQLGLPLLALSFGNLRETGFFLSHFVRHPTSNDRLVSANYLLGEDAMFVDFEHDRGIFTVVFAAYGEKPFIHWGREEKEGIPNTLGCLYAIRVKYESIRRIIVDTCPKSKGQPALRMYFLLNYPPEIKRLPPVIFNRNLHSGDRKRSIPQYEGDRRDNCAVINECPMLLLEFKGQKSPDELYCAISRLNVRTRIQVEFSNVFVEEFDPKLYVGLPVLVIGADYRSCAREETRGEIHEYIPPFPKVNEYWSNKLSKYGCFGLEYLIAALLTRGAIVKDQILISKEARDNFLLLVTKEFEQKPEVALEALERLLNFLDETKQVNSLLRTYKKILENLKGDPEILREILQKSEDGSYARVRKMIVTPTRTLLVVPELLMGNRVLRTFDETGDGALRVQFRDDDGTKLRINNTGGYLIQTTVHNTLYRGVNIANRHFVYLASSNSQMRDNGCYFFDDGEGGQAQKIRESLGKFDKTNIPKLMSRIGQCFTQAEQCDAVLERKRYNKVHDFIGGKDGNGDPYTFSDGVGKMSCEFASKIAEKMNMGGFVPSCFQIRYRGVKGVLSVDPAMDERRLWAEKNGVKDSTKLVKKTIYLHVLFRPSQDKFNAPRNENIEIVKHSSPIPVCLNRPLICIMDQVSEMQGYELHTKVCGRIHSLLDRQLMQMAEILMSEDRWAFESSVFSC
uniref:RNA-dependent RNA polymerase n=1 Tax=Syphacia muris TaxID=451379 RepID=A0A0N5A9G0_9BILA